MSLVIVLVVLVASALATVRLGRGLRPITIAAALLLAGIALQLPIGLDPAVIVDRGRLWIAAALVAALVLGGLVAWRQLGAAEARAPIAKLLIVGAAGSLLSGLALVRAADMTLDGSAATPHAARVEVRESVGGRKGGRTWHVELGDTDVANVRRLRVDEEQYAQLRVGAPVHVLVHDGAFGIRWVSGIEPAR